ncbi:microtubule-associated serine/threonine-protein kinase 2-like isoform X2 [Halichondria panicea]|uniref:microtubule-associated serine/threonine-protein kinase 2-like isoform X2 n=1 Tax=Halichondria panicea TaxID=6063 RepID=UPI00312B9AD6
MSSRPRVPKLRIPGQRSSLSDYESDNDELNKTLPHNFKFGQHLTAPPTMQSSSLRSSPIRSMASSSRSPRTTSIQRRQPVAANSRPSPSRFKNKERCHHLNKSDPAIARNCLLSPEDSFEEDYTYQHDSLARREGLKLPARAQSLNYPKSPQSPRIASPSPGEFPSTSPRNWHPINPNFMRFADGRRSDMGERGRRWSVVSVASSGYKTEATDSPISLSSYPSHEQIHQLPTTPTMDDFNIFVRHFRSDSDGSVVITDDNGQPIDIIRPRPRARSLSPERSPREILLDLDATHNIFKDKFPRAKEEMEEKLQDFLTKYSESKYELADSTLNFGRHKILECAREICEKSRDGIITKDSIIQMSDDLQLVLRDVKDRTGNRPECLEHLVRKLLIIVGRIARLLEIMQFDPEDFSSTIADSSLDKPTRLMFMSSSHMPYILNRLSTSLTSQEEGDTEDGEGGQMRGKRTTSVDWKPAEPAKQHSRDDFNVIKPISNGAYGAVYLVRHRETGTRFAMKKVSKHRTAMKKQVQQVFYERDILSFAENPFVVGLWCTFQDKSYLYMVMEYVEGGDVGTLLKNISCLPVDLATMYFAETVLALEYIHSYGVIHRDLKPDNLLITSEGHIKLTDFGLSKIGLVNYTAHVIEDAWTRDRQFKDAEVYGTPDYIAPEVILGQAYGFAVDWWSMGVILYEMMIGTTPFWSTTVQELFEEITDENLVINWPDAEDDDIPPEGKDIVEQLLCHDPYSRLGSSTRGGVDVVKEHPFFDDLDWRNLLLRKSEFIPSLSGEDDTSYFDPRTDRYSHDFASDEEDGPGDEDLQEEFKNFGTTTPRFSHLLDQLSFEDISNPPTPSSGPQSIASKIILEPNHEKRDSGISGIEDPAVKILDDDGDDAVTVLRHDSAESVHTVEDKDEEATDDDNDDGVITHIDEVSEDESNLQPTPTGTITPHTPPTSSTMITPPRHESLSPFSASMGQKNVRVEGSSKLSVTTLSDLDIMVSPPTPGGIADTSSGSSILESLSPIGSPRSSMVSNPITIKRGSNGFGIIFKAVRVYLGESNDYRMHHIVESVDKKSPAWEAGIRKDQLITHINGVAIIGLQHVQVISLMVDKKNTVITISTIPLEQTSIQKDKKKRSPSLGHRIGKMLRHRSSSGRLKSKKQSFFKRLSRNKSGRGLDSPGHSSSGTPSPKHPSSPHRSDSFKQRLAKVMGGGTSRRSRHTPMSPLARSTSPVGLGHNPPSSCSPPGSMSNVSNSTPPNSPTNPNNRRPERHSMFVDSQLLVHQKSFSGDKKSSPHTSPLLTRAMSPSGRNKPKRSITLPREGGREVKHHKKTSKSKSVHLSTPERTEEADEGLTNF